MKITKSKHDNPAAREKITQLIEQIKRRCADDLFRQLERPKNAQATMLEAGVLVLEYGKKLWLIDLNYPNVHQNSNVEGCGAFGLNDLGHYLIDYLGVIGKLTKAEVALAEVMIEEHRQESRRGQNLSQLRRLAEQLGYNLVEKKES